MTDTRGDLLAPRIARVAQQLRSLVDLHGRELEALAGELDAAGAPTLAARVRVFQGLHADEVGVAIQELEDMRQVEFEPAGQADVEPLGEDDLAEDDPAARSPKRARWLEEVENTRRAMPRPLSRREMLTLGRESEPD